MHNIILFIFGWTLLPKLYWSLVQNVRRIKSYVRTRINKAVGNEKYETFSARIIETLGLCFTIMMIFFFFYVNDNVLSLKLFIEPSYLSTV